MMRFTFLGVVVGTLLMANVAVSAATAAATATTSLRSTPSVPSNNNNKDWDMILSKLEALETIVKSQEEMIQQIQTTLLVQDQELRNQKQQQQRRTLRDATGCELVETTNGTCTLQNGADLVVEGDFKTYGSSNFTNGGLYVGDGNDSIIRSGMLFTGFVESNGDALFTKSVDFTNDVEFYDGVSFFAHVDFVTTAPEEQVTFKGPVVMEGSTVSIQSVTTFTNDVTIEGPSNSDESSIDFDIDGKVDIEIDNEDERFEIKNPILFEGDVTIKKYGSGSKSSKSAKSSDQPNLYVGGMGEFHQDVYIDEDLEVDGDVTINSDTTILGDTTIGGDTTIDGLLNVNSDLFLAEDLIVDKTLTVNGKDDLGIVGTETSTIQGPLTTDMIDAESVLVESPVLDGGGVQIGTDSVTITSMSVTVSSPSDTTIIDADTIDTDGDVNIDGSLTVGTTVTVDGTQVHPTPP